MDWPSIGRSPVRSALASSARCEEQIDGHGGFMAEGAGRNLARPAGGERFTHAPFETTSLCLRGADRQSRRDCRRRAGGRCRR